mgnify:CR=1 FL=1
MSAVGLYIHVPFCVKKCPYCDFYSITDHNSDLFDKYTDAVVRNIKKYLSENKNLLFDTVYFGGGTPSIMPVSFYEAILKTISQSCSIESSEITIELNPKTADKDKIVSLRNVGINRLSVGIQSANDTELADLGRIHNFAEASEIILSAHEAGFDNISADLMISIKNQTIQTLKNSIDMVTALPVKHISAYILKIEKGTVYYKNNISDYLPDDDKTAEMYIEAVRRLSDKGFKQYEISNFSKHGFQSKHNLKYWYCQEYIGIGPSAHSFFNNKRYEVPKDVNKFTLSEYQNEIINEEHPGDFFEKAMLALRLTEGLDLKPYPEYVAKVIKHAEKFRKASLLKINDRVISLTPQGFLVSNSIISDLLSEF